MNTWNSESAQFSKLTKLLDKQAPSKIYIENVRSVFDVSYGAAERFCETAVRQGLFERQVEVNCPDGSVAASAHSEDALPPIVRCLVRDEEGSIESVEVPTRDLHKTVFYRPAHHDELEEARIALAWNMSWQPDVDGRCTLGKFRNATETRGLA